MKARKLSFYFSMKKSKKKILFWSEWDGTWSYTIHLINERWEIVFFFFFLIATKIYFSKRNDYMVYERRNDCAIRFMLYIYQHIKQEHHRKVWRSPILTTQMLKRLKVCSICGVYVYMVILPLLTRGNLHRFILGSERLITMRCSISALTLDLLYLVL